MADVGLEAVLAELRARREGQARFETKLDTELRALREGQARLETKLDTELRALREGQARLETRLDRVEARLGHLENRVGELEAQFRAATGGGSVSLVLLMEQQRRVLDELGRLRDDMTVTTAIALRVDSTIEGLTREVHGEHVRHDRLRLELDRVAAKVERLEAAQHA